jgi:hypothetical protein
MSADMIEAGNGADTGPGPEEFLTNLVNEDGSLDEDAAIGAEIEMQTDEAEARGEFLRGPDGRFVSADDDRPYDEYEAEEEADYDEADEAHDDDGYVRPPAGMSAADREAFYRLPSDQQQWLVERERQLEGGASRKINEYAERVKATEPLERVLAPYREKFAHMGARPEEVVNQLLTLADHADRDFAGFVREQARLRGIPIEAFGTGAEGGHQADDPRLMAALQKVAQLEGIIGQDMQQRQAMVLHGLERVVEDVENDVENFPHFAQLQEDMLPIVVSLRQAHPGMHPRDILARAYKAALSLNDEVSARVDADRRAREDAMWRRRAREDAARARRSASGNIRGGGALPAGDGISGNDLSRVEDFIGREFDRMARA